MMEASSVLDGWSLVTLAGMVLFGIVGCGSIEKAAEESDEKSPEEVEVGYGSQEKENTTGSISSLSSAEVENTVEKEAITHIEELFQGRVAGVYVQRTSAGGFAVRIRGRTSFHGNNQPLYIIDGMPFSPPPGQGIVGLNPQDIESIDIVKDGSAAVYGSRGANGVVIIKTKGAH